MIDTHTHIYLEEFEQDRTDVMTRAEQAGLRHLIFPNVDLSTIAPMYALHDAYPSFTSMAMGLHPTEVDADYRKSIDIVAGHLQDYPFVAIGEIGIDLYWDSTYRKEQCDAFITQVSQAVERSLPIIIHCREGLTEILECFSHFKELPPAVFHSFTGTIDDIRQIRQYGDFYFGINGIVTFKKSAIPAILPEIGIDHILLETDSPYLSPVPNRGKRNESANIPYICDCIASHLHMAPQEVSITTDNNANKLFNLNFNR